MGVVSILVLLFIVAGLAAMFIGVLLVVRFIVSNMQGGGAPAARLTAQRAVSQEMTAEDEGNVHSGPYGYSPNTAYPETQYGSLFNPDAEWAHEEEM